MNSPTDRRRNQRDRILALLQERGPAGVSNLELYSICLRPPSRICELRKLGHRIRTIRENKNRFSFVLVSKPDRRSTSNGVPDYAATMERDLRDAALPLFAGTERNPR